MGPVYVPVLPVRRAAWQAYERLDDRLRRRIAPLWTIGPRTGPERPRGDPAAVAPDSDPPLLNSWLVNRVDQLLNALSGAVGWVDPAHVEGLAEASAIGLWHLTTSSRLRLVTGPERDPVLQRYTADLAFLSGRGLGVRILLDGSPPESRSVELLSLVDRLYLPPEQLDLILDLGPVHDVTDSTKTALAAIDLLGGLLPWRTVILVGGAFPRTVRAIDSRELLVVPRYDRQVYRLVRASRSELPAALVYGDYAAEHALSANVPPAQGPGPGWALMRYTTPDVFLIGGVPTRGPRRADRIRSMARRIVEDEAFRADASDGERWLDACAYGEGSHGTGNAETWIRVGHNQHLSLAVEQLTADEA